MATATCGPPVYTHATTCWWVSKITVRKTLVPGGLYHGHATTWRMKTNNGAVYRFFTARRYDTLSQIVCQSVRPSRSGIVSKRLNKSSEFFHQSIGDCRNEYSDTSDHRHWETGWNVLTTRSDRHVIVTSQVRSYFFVRWQRLRARQRDRQTRPNIIITSPCIYTQYIVQ